MDGRKRNACAFYELKSDRMELPDSPISPQLSAEGERLWAECLARNRRLRPQPPSLKSPVLCPPRPLLHDVAAAVDGRRTADEISQRSTNLEVPLNLPSSTLEPTPPPSNTSTPVAVPSSSSLSVNRQMWMGHRKKRLVHTMDFKSLRILPPSSDHQTPAALMDIAEKYDPPQSAVDHQDNVVSAIDDQLRTLSTAEVPSTTSRSSSTGIGTASSVDRMKYKYIPTPLRFQDLFKVPSTPTAAATTTTAIYNPTEQNSTLPVKADDVPTKEIGNCVESLTGKGARGDADGAHSDSVSTTTPVVGHQGGPQLPRLVINGHDYSVLREIGKGGSSKVVEAHDGQQAYAIKCVDLNDADETIRKGYINEITILKQVQHSRRVIRLYDHEYNRDEQKLYVVMERGDVDMATFIKNEAKDGGIRAIFVKCYWAEMLMAVRDIHKAEPFLPQINSEGIIHSDLKPANFLLVAGKLKLIDFGISSAIPNDLTSIIKDVKCGTPNYMSPEALMEVESPPLPTPIIANDDGANHVEDAAAAAIKQTRIKIGVKSDVWSLGCILYHMVYGRTPFEHLSYHRRLLAIVDPSYVVQFPPHSNPLVIEVLKRCIVRDVKQRASVDELLNHPYVSRD